jgi:IS5 family transposase
MYRRLLARTNHFLVRVHDHLDCSPLEVACAGYHHSSGPGAPVAHPVPRLVRALLAKYLLNLSLRELEEAIRWNLLVKWFVGYAIFEAGPDHATLERFELWVIEHQARTFFDEVLHQIDRHFPEERRKPQIGDTFAIHADAARESLIRLIRHTCQRLLTSLDSPPSSPLRTQVEDQLDLAALFGPPDEVQEYRLQPAERRQRLAATAAAAFHCLRVVETTLASHPPLPSVQHQEITDWLAILAKVLADEVHIAYDPDGHVRTVHELPKAQKGTYRLGSATDPDATYRVHGERTDFGFNANLAATDTFIREIRADTGCQPDPIAIPDVLQAQLEHHDLLPAKFIYDQAAGTGKAHADVAAATDGQTQLVAPLIPYAQRSQRFGPDDFVLAPDGQSLTCPNGHVTTTAYRSQSGAGRYFRFSASQCTDCPLAALCRADQVAPHHMRQVFISDHRSVLAQARTYSLTPEFRADLKLRSTIERTISNLVRYHGARRARRRGQPKVDFQAKMNAMAFNLRQWMRQLAQRPSVAATP